MATCFRSIGSLTSITHSPRDAPRSGIVLSSCSVLPITGRPINLPQAQTSSRTALKPRKPVTITMMV